MPTTVIESIGDGKDYANILAWDNAHHGENQTSTDRIYIGEVYPGEHSNSTFVSFNKPDSRVDSTRYRILRAATGHKYDPVTDSGVKIVNDAAGIQNPFRMRENFFRFEGIGVFNEAVTSGFKRCFRIDKRCWINGVYAKLTGGTNVNNAVFQLSAAFATGETYLTNCIAEGEGTADGLPASGAAAGFSTALGAMDHYLLNCNAYNVKFFGSVEFGSSGWGFVVGPNTYLHNCVSTDSRVLDFVELFGTPQAFSFCASSDASATGTGSLTNIDPVEWYGRPGVSLGQFRLGNISPGIDAGMNLESIWPDATPTDYINVRHGAIGQWEMGAYAFGGTRGHEDVGHIAVGR